jgi:ActR/RegA family two-component response regulator
VSDSLEITVKVTGAVRAADVLQRALEPGDSLGPVLPLDVLTKLYARHVLELCAGNKSRTARLLGVSRRSLYRLLEPEAV